MCTHYIINCLRTADFYCIHGTHRSDISMRTGRKIVHTFAVRIVIYFAGRCLNIMVIYMYIAPGCGHMSP